MTLLGTFMAINNTHYPQSNVYKRRDFIQKRRALSATQRQQLAGEASLHLYKLPRRLPIPKHAKVGIYYDDFGELPTQLILDWCIRLGYQPYLPVVDSSVGSDVGSFIPNKRLRFVPIYRHKLLNLTTYRHALGMKQVRQRQRLWAEELDILFCPLVAVDKTGTRMGMGGSYYDRSLAKSYQLHLPKPITIGWCYDFQLVDTLERQAWDVPMDMVITNKQLLRINNTISQK